MVALQNDPFSNEFPSKGGSSPSGNRGSRFGIRLKLTVALLSTVLLSLLVTTLIANAIITRTFGSSAETKARETSKIILGAMEVISQELAIRTDALAVTEDFQKSLSFHETSDIEHALKDLTKRSGSDFAVVIGLEGNVEAASDGGPLGKAIATSEPMAEAQKKHATLRGLYAVGSDVYFLAIVPIEHIGSQLGFVIDARHFSDELATQLGQRGGAQVGLFTEKGLIARSGAMSNMAVPINDLWSTLKSGGEEAWGGRVQFGDERYMLLARPLLGSGKLVGGLVTALSERDFLAVQRRTNGGFLLISFVIGLGATAMGLWFGRRLSHPISEITRSFREIASSGDLTRRIDKQYPDEIGLMAESFNKMQQRIFLLHEQVAAAEKRMRKELEMASVVQDLLFSRNATAAPTIELVGFNKPSTETGGDWFTIHENLVNGHTIVVIADVTGHGAPAALVAAITHGFFNGVKKHVSDGRLDLIEALSELNRTIIEAANGSLMMTLLVANIDHKTRRMTYVNAGHLQPLLVQPDGRVRSIASPPSAQIGVSLESTFTTQHHDLSPGDTIFMFTDGLNECENMDGEQYGMKRLINELRRAAPKMTPAELREHISTQAFAFYGGRPPDDDISFIIGRVR